MRFRHAAISAALFLTGTALTTPAFAEQGKAAAAASVADPKPLHFGSWGVDLAARDTAVKPGDDFDMYANGGWKAKTEIPADQASAGVDYDVFNLTQDQLRAVVSKASAGSQIGALYQSFMDEARIEQIDAKPLMADLAKIDAISSPDEMTRFMGSTQGRFGVSIVGAGPYADPDTPTMNALWVGSGGLGLPDRDYYLTDSFKPQRDAYRAYIERTLKMVGVADAGAAADKIMALETDIAKATWPIADRRDFSKINNPMSSAELATYAPEVNWKAFFEGAAIPDQKRLILQENTSIRDIAKLYAATPLETLKLWEKFHVTHQASPYLSKRFVDSRFNFTKTLSGVTEIRPRWKRGLTLVDGSLGELVGKTYVDNYFPASSKAQMEELVANLKAAMADRIKGNSWMAAPTKTAALDKLSRMEVMVGYPDKWRDYSKLTIAADDLYGNVQRSGVFEYQYQLSDLGQTVDRKKWGMTPQTVNAYNGGLENKIVFPAGILQAPYFDPKADAAVNYGAIGSVIGHEISHGFDDQGRKIDASGALKDWWTAEDAKKFEAQSEVFGAQYAKYEAAPGAFVNPKLTMGENIADLAGLQVAYDAYHRSLGGKPAPVIDGLTGDQRFFLAFAQGWRSKEREDAIKSQVASDPHTPSRFRVIGPVRNLDAWYAAFGIGPDSKFYIAPEQRVRIW
jgi:putative endopeptidase